MNDSGMRRDLLDRLKAAERIVRADLLAQYRADPALMALAMARLEAEEASVADGSAWLETFAGRAAVLYLLKTLYVRVLEDQDLVRPVRLREGGSYETFRRLFPQLGHAAYLRAVFRDAERALPELFVRTAVEIAEPSEASASAVWSVWQEAASGGRPRFDFRGDLDTRFIGDLYQDLDPEVKARYALLQTPRFIERFILDRTLTPAIERFGLDEIRLIDPTCGSGHFLLGAFEDVFAQWAARLGPGAETTWEAAQRALASVYGADLNEYACALTRFRLLLAVVRMTGVRDLERLRTLHANVIVCDSLIPWERLAAEGLPGIPIAWLEHYGSDEERAAATAFFARGFHAVVGNPPYISVKDKKKREDYRRAWPRSASGKYSLSAPMTERFLTMPVRDGYSGLIVANNFCKREFGKGLIEKVLREVRLELVVDTSGAYLPGHGTPTVMLFASRRVPALATHAIPVVAGKRGEPREPEIAERGLVWSSIAAHAGEIGYDDTWIAVQSMPQATLLQHPWSLGTDAVLALKAKLDAFPRLKSLGAEAGPAVIIIEDEAFIRRYARGLPLRPTVFGEDVRDWQIRDSGLKVLPAIRSVDQKPEEIERICENLWHLRSSLYGRPTFGGQTYRQRPDEKKWWQFHQVTASRLGAGVPKIAVGEVATNSQFVLDESDAIFTRTSPVVTLGAADHATYRRIAALLNSSTLEFWFKRVCFDKGSGGIGGGIAAEAWEKCYVRNGTNVLQAPILSKHSDSITALLNAIEMTSLQVRSSEPRALFHEAVTAASIDATASILGQERELLVSLQEELDWLVYRECGISVDAPLCDVASLEPLTRGHRPFEIALARRMARGEETSAWFERQSLTPVVDIPDRYTGPMRETMERRLALIEADPTLGVLEQPVYKRRWAFQRWESMLVTAAETHVLDRIDAVVRERVRLFSLDELLDRLRTDTSAMAAAPYAKTPSDIDLTATVSRLLARESIPDNPARLFIPQGLAKFVGAQTAATASAGSLPEARPFLPGERVDWKRVWRLQEREDADEHPEVAVPPPFVIADYLHPNGWRIRGKFNIPNERVIVYDEVTPKRYAWGGWIASERAALSMEIFELRGREPDGASVTPTDGSPSRCGVQFPLWDKLDELRRTAEAGFDDVRTIADLCGRACPCDVLDRWRETSLARKTGATKAPVTKSNGRVVAAAKTTAREPVSAAIGQNVLDEIRKSGLAGCTAAEIEPFLGGDRDATRDLLDSLRAEGIIEPIGRGRGMRYRLPPARLL